MAGTAQIEELIDGALSILAVAQKAGPDGWTFTGTTLTINSKPLADAVKKVLDKANVVEIETEMRNLNPFQAIGLARHVLTLLPKALGAK